MPNAAIARLCQVFISCLANQKKKQKERGQVNSYAIHILDAFFVEGQNMLTEGDLNKVVSIEKRYEFFFVWYFFSSTWNSQKLLLFSSCSFSKACETRGLRQVDNEEEPHRFASDPLERHYQHWEYRSRYTEQVNKARAACFVSKSVLLFILFLFFLVLCRKLANDESMRRPRKAFTYRSRSPPSTMCIRTASTFSGTYSIRGRWWRARRLNPNTSSTARAAFPHMNSPTRLLASSRIRSNFE